MTCSVPSRVDTVELNKAIYDMRGAFARLDKQEQRLRQSLRRQQVRQAGRSLSSGCRVQAKHLQAQLLQSLVARGRHNLPEPEPGTAYEGPPAVCTSEVGSQDASLLRELAASAPELELVPWSTIFSSGRRRPCAVETAPVSLLSSFASPSPHARTARGACLPQATRSAGTQGLPVSLLARLEAAESANGQNASVAADRCGSHAPRGCDSLSTSALTCADEASVSLSQGYPKGEADGATPVKPLRMRQHSTRHRQQQPLHRSPGLGGTP